MVEYGVNTNNKFVFLEGDDDVEDPQELIRRAEIAQKKDERTASQKKADKTAAAKAKKEAMVAVAQAAAAREEAAKKAPATGGGARGKENRPDGERGGRGGGRGRGGERGGRGAGGERRGGGPPKEHPERDTLAERFGETRGSGRGARGGRGGSGSRPFRGRGGNQQHDENGPKHRADAPFNDSTGDQLNTSGEDAPRGGYRGRGRGGFSSDRPRGRGGFGRVGGRQFDRLSGSDKTGVKPTEKKDGHGRGNWGDDKDELVGETEPVVADGEEQAPAPPREKTEEEKAREAEEAELAKQKTLAEFKAELQSKKDQPKFNIRKGGEDDASFGKLVSLNKDKHEDVHEETIVVRREPRAKQLDIDIHFTDSVGRSGNSDRGERPSRGGDRPFRGGAPRGGRGGPRGGGGGRGTPGNGARGGPHFEVNDAAFPALG